MSKIINEMIDLMQELEAIGVASKDDVADVRKLTKRNKPDLAKASYFSADKIRSLRISNNVSQSVFADMLGTKTSTLQKWETGVNAPKGPALTLLNLVDRKGLKAIKL